MNKKYKRYGESIFLLVFLCFLVGCSKQKQEFEYTMGGVYFEQPSFLEKGRYQSALSTQTDAGVFHIMTDDEEEADGFVNAQLELLSYLERRNVELRNLNYYVSNYDDTFSDSAHDSAYIGLVSTKTYKQVLVTLQTLWGEYADYGYLYALSNKIAKELKWGGDDVPEVENVTLDKFFSENVAAMNLLYPCFSSEYASEETIDNCKALSAKLLKDKKIKQTLSRPIEEQIAEFRLQTDEYAEKLQVDFERNKCRYAYNGQYIPLKILTTYAEYFVDVDYEDRADYLSGLFSDYAGIFEAMEIVEKELCMAVEKFDLKEEVKVIPFKCLSSESANYLYGKDLVNFTRSEKGEIIITFLNSYYHEYHHYLFYILNPSTSSSWQEEAFCELARSYSYYGRLNVEVGMMKEEKWQDFFSDFTERKFVGGREDYYDFYEILSHACEDFELRWDTGRNPINAITKYLVEIYGEDTVVQLYLYPEIVAEVTGKEWNQHIYEWGKDLKEKYSGCKVPEWMLEDLKSRK